MNNQTAPKEYTGSCYIGWVGPEGENGECRDSIEHLILDRGDSFPVPVRATKGYEARNIHFERWLTKTEHPFMLLLDHDHVFPPDTLRRLRSHKLPYVSGHYLRRRYEPIAPVWFEPFSGSWPFKPFMKDPERGKLHELGASGWGCILIHRDVALAVQALLHHEPLVLEDDMDIWAYDLDKLIAALRILNGLQNGEIKEDGARAFRVAVKTLNENIRPLRGVKDPAGSDIRFPFYAKQAGYTLWGDPDVRVPHMLNYPLSPDDYSGQTEESKLTEAEVGLQGYFPERRRMKELAAVQRGEAWECPLSGNLNPVTEQVSLGCDEARK